jgi:hypothetical protein
MRSICSTGKTTTGGKFKKVITGEAMTDAYDDIPEPIRRAFADEPYLPAPTVARGCWG